MPRPLKVSGLPPLPRRMVGTLRMPELQHAQAKTVQSFQGSLMVQDAIRRAGTTSNRICRASLPSPQVFLEPSGGTNTPGSMAAGGVKMNARRNVSKTRGQSAGVR